MRRLAIPALLLTLASCTSGQPAAGDTAASAPPPGPALLFSDLDGNEREAARLGCESVRIIRDSLRAKDGLDDAQLLELAEGAVDDAQLAHLAGLVNAFTAVRAQIRNPYRDSVTLEAVKGALWICRTAEVPPGTG